MSNVKNKHRIDFPIPENHRNNILHDYIDFNIVFGWRNQQNGGHIGFFIQISYSNDVKCLK